MRQGCSEKIEELTGRKVVGFMSDDHIDPDMAVEVFILQPLDDPLDEDPLAGVGVQPMVRRRVSGSPEPDVDPIKFD